MAIGSHQTSPCKTRMSNWTKISPAGTAAIAWAETDMGQRSSRAWATSLLKVGVGSRTKRAEGLTNPSSKRASGTASLTSRYNRSIRGSKSRMAEVNRRPGSNPAPRQALTRRGQMDQRAHLPWARTRCRSVSESDTMRTTEIEVQGITCQPIKVRAATPSSANARSGRMV